MARTGQADGFICPQTADLLRWSAIAGARRAVRKRYRPRLAAALTRIDRAQLKAEMKAELARLDEAFAPDRSHASPHNLY